MGKEQKDSTRDSSKSNGGDESASTIKPDVEGAPVDTSDVTTIAPAAAATSKKKFDVKAFLRTKKGKITTAILAVVMLVTVVFIVPASRYAVAGLVIKKDVAVMVTDAETGKAVSAADITLGDQTYKTNAKGEVTFKSVAVGSRTVNAKKSYYQDTKSDVLVPILSNPGTVVIKMTATGRQVPVSVTNKVSGAALAGVEITAGDSVATTAENGEATIVLPADKQTVSATFKLQGYQDVAADITVLEQTDDKNKFALAPSGKVYFLSKRTGKINVMSSNLDGSDQKVVVEGTGKESQTTTTLLASRDWKYLALYAKRDDKEKLYLITTTDNKLTLMDEGDVDFTLHGWQNDHFVYTVVRPGAKQWESNRQTLKTFNATNAKLTKLDTSGVGGSNDANWENEAISNVYILDDRIIYSKHWNRAYNPAFPTTTARKDGIYSVKANGESKQTLRDFDTTAASYIDARLYEPQEVFFRVAQPGGTGKFYVYESGKVETTTETNDSAFYSGEYPTYLISPSGKKTFWTESRDGKLALMVGDASGHNGKEILRSEYRAYGWFTDDYLLVSKNGSELYILSVNAAADVNPVKITDYHKPAYNYSGYGYGYGGL